MTSADLLAHRRMLMCRRADLGTTVVNKLSQGTPVDCEELKMKRIDSLMCVLARHNVDAALNCITTEQACDIVKYLYTLLPEDC